MTWNDLQQWNDIINWTDDIDNDPPSLPTTTAIKQTTNMPQWNNFNSGYANCNTARSITNSDATYVAQFSGSSLFVSASNTQIAPYAVTSSFALNGGANGTSLTTGSTYQITSSWAQNVATTSVIITSSFLTGSNVNNVFIAFDNNHTQSINTAGRFQYDQFGIISNAYALRDLYDSSGIISLTYGSRTLLDTSQNISIDWANRYLDNVNGQVTVDYQNRLLQGGSWTCNNLTASSHFGTSSWATNVVNGSSYNQSSSIFGTASWSSNSVSASYALNGGSGGGGNGNVVAVNGNTTLTNTSSLFVVLQQTTNSYHGMFVNYTIVSGSNNLRAGTLVSSFSGNTSSYYENFSTPLGNNGLDVTCSISISSSFIQFLAQSTTYKSWIVSGSSTFI